MSHKIENNIEIYTILPLPLPTRLCRSKKCFSRVIRPAVGARTKDFDSSLNVLRFYHPSDAAGSSNVSCWNGMCLSTETWRLNAQDQAATIIKFSLSVSKIWRKKNREYDMILMIL